MSNQMFGAAPAQQQQRTAAASAGMDDIMGEAQVPVEKRAKLASTLEDIIGRSIDAAIERSDTRWEARFEEMMGRLMEKVD